MGQATRNIKTRASAGLSLAGIVGAGARAGAAIGTKTRAAPRSAILAGAQAGARIPPIAPSKPVPDPTVHFIGYQPMDNPKPPNPRLGPDAWKLIPGNAALGTTGGFESNGPHTRRPSAAAGVGAITAGAQAGLGGGTTSLDPAWKSYDALVGGAGRVIQGAGVGATQGDKKRREKAAKDPGPDAKALAEVQLQVSSALRDNTWSVQERQQIAQTYRDFWLHFSGSDTSLMSLNNYAVQSEYRRYLQQWHDNGQNGKHTADWGTGDFFNTYSGVLESEADDQYGPGFILDKDEEGWYKISNVQDLQAQIEATMRKDPVAAAEMITRLTAWGAYGGAQEKYSKNNVVFDKYGNPVKARWTKDDQVALAQFLHDVAKQQEAAKDGTELQPWQNILVQVSTDNQAIGASPGYGGGGGGGGYRRYGHGYGGYGGGGGGGGGGVSYTDSDQLKQLINAIARARLGYALNDDQIAQFVTEYHTKEAAFVNARIAGQSGQQLDPESQAAAWIESHFRDAMAAQQGNSYISALANFLMNGSFGSTT